MDKELKVSLASIYGAQAPSSQLRRGHKRLGSSRDLEVRRWVTEEEFVAGFSRDQILRGVNSANFVPSSLICFLVAQVWRRYRGRPWHRAFENGLAPIGTGLIFAGAVAMLRLGAEGPLWPLWPLSWGVTVAAAALITWRARPHPFALLVGGAAVFIAANAAMT